MNIFFHACSAPDPSVPSASHCLSTGLVRKAIEKVKLQVEYALSVVAAAIKNLWTRYRLLILLPVCALNLCASTLEYFREALNETWTTSQQMFEAFDKYVLPVTAGACWLCRQTVVIVSSHAHGLAERATTCPWRISRLAKKHRETAPVYCLDFLLHFHISPSLMVRGIRCTLFWFFCRTNFKEPDNPNACPYSSVHDMLENIEAQPQWIEWRSAPLNQRAALARNIAKQFHPDKWDTFNPTCDVDHAGAQADAWRQGAE